MKTGLKDVIMIAATGNHSTIVIKDGTVVTWGCKSKIKVREPEQLEKAKALFMSYKT